MILRIKSYALRITYYILRIMHHASRITHHALPITLRLRHVNCLRGSEFFSFKKNDISIEFWRNAFYILKVQI
jgi:hypothetical protein